MGRDECVVKVGSLLQPAQHTLRNSFSRITLPGDRAQFSLRGTFERSSSGVDDTAPRPNEQRNSKADALLLAQSEEHNIYETI